MDSETRVMPSRRTGAVRWWAERIYKKVREGLFAGHVLDCDEQDIEATIQELEGMVLKIKNGPQKPRCGCGMIDDQPVFCGKHAKQLAKRDKANSAER